MNAGQKWLNVRPFPNIKQDSLFLAHKYSTSHCILSHLGVTNTEQKGRINVARSKNGEDLLEVKMGCL